MRSAAAVQALEAQGAIVVGKTNADEFAWGVAGHNAHWGDTQNPRLPGRITGGSSSGSAAAVAAGFVSLALGTDTGGSVRMPAACCGVVGLKPRIGAPPAGVFALCPSFDTVGPIARSVADCALAHTVLYGGAVPEPRIAGLRAGLLAAPPRLDPAAAPGERDARAPALATALEELGAHVQEIELPVPGADPWPLFYAEAGASHRATFPARRDEYGPTIRAKLDHSQRVDRRAVDAARTALAAWRAHAAADPPVDVIVSPTLGFPDVPALEVDELEIRFAMSAYTRPFSFLGWPAIAIGDVQLAARDETTLIGAALAWERAYGLTSPAER
jgi:aspartyl-tRNA(Asn)/glutamyl-tRNA(Gln) amidotransferase subunit A